MFSNFKLSLVAICSWYSISSFANATSSHTEITEDFATDDINVSENKEDELPSVDKKLLDIANEINKNTPSSLGEIGYLKETKYENKNFTIHIMFNDKIVNIQNMKNQTEVFKENAMTIFGSKYKNSSTSNLISNIAEANASLTCIYEAMVSGDSIRIFLSKEEVLQTLKEAEETNKDPEALIAKQCRISNIHMPIKVDEQTTLNRTILEKKQVIYDFIIDEQLLDMKELKKDKKAIKLRIYLALRPQYFLKLCKETKRNIIYRYTGNKTGKSISIKVPYKDLP